MNFNTDIRIEKELTRGGEASISRGMLINPNWREKYSLYADSVVIKSFFIKSGANLQEQERATLKFQQEIAVIL